MPPAAALLLAIFATLVVSFARVASAECTAVGRDVPLPTNDVLNDDHVLVAGASGTFPPIVATSTKIVRAAYNLPDGSRFAPSLIAGSDETALPSPASTPTPRTEGTGAGARFLAIHSMAYDAATSTVFVLDDDWIWGVNATTGAARMLGANQVAFTGSPVAMGDGELLVGLEGCVIGLNTTWLLSTGVTIAEFRERTNSEMQRPKFGLCGTISTKTLDAAFPRTEAIGRAQRIGFVNPGGVVPTIFTFSTSSAVRRWLFAVFDVAGFDAEIRPGSTLDSSPNAMHYLFSEMAYVRRGCTMGFVYLEQFFFRSAEATAGNAATLALCAADPSIIAFASVREVNPTRAWLTFAEPVADSQGRLHRDVVLEGCGIDAATAVGGGSSSSSGSSSESSGSLDTVYIVVIAVSALLVVVVVIAVAVVVVVLRRRRSPHAAQHQQQQQQTAAATAVTIASPTNRRQDSYPASTAGREPFATTSESPSVAVVDLERRRGSGGGNGSIPKTVARRIDLLRQGAFQRGKLLGRGAFGSVFAVLLANGTTVAMKELRLEGSGDEIDAQLAVVTREVQLLQRLQHASLVGYYHAEADAGRGEARIFMELVTGGSLASLVRGMAPERLADGLAAKFTRDVVEGLAFLHANHVVHRDLKCDNVLIDDAAGRAKITDFGTARVVNAMATRRSAAAARTLTGTPGFMAPEVCAAGGSLSGSTASVNGSGNQPAEPGSYGVAADVWSLGILVAEMADGGRMPWPDFASPMHALMHVANGGRPVVPVGRVSAGCAGFIEACLVVDPAQRPTAAELLGHPWLAQVANSEAAADDAPCDFATNA